MIKIEIKNIFTGSIIFEYSKENNTIKETIEKAVKDGANLDQANLVGANLVGANLFRANLYGANLERANLVGANLERANLERANLYGANLERANLYGANLYGANLVGANLFRANLVGANLYGAIKLPIYCKWTHGITENKIHIGCEKRTIEEWDLFFNGNDIIQTQRDTKEFKQIQAVFEAYKAYLNFLKDGK